MKKGPWLLPALAGLFACATAAHAALPNNVASRRVIYYDQTIYHGPSSNAANYVSLAPLMQAPNLDPATGKPYVTDVLVGALHLGAQTDGSSLHLNDNTLDDPIFDPLWNETAALQAQGVNVLAFLGGAAQGSYANLFDGNGNLTSFYGVLKQALQEHHFNGIDLDVEETFPLANAEKLITQLRADFGPDFLITMAPVASALQGGTDTFSGFNYKTLFQDQGNNIAWFNVQFYSGFGSMSSTSSYDAILSAGFPADKVVAGTLGSSNDGFGFVDPNTVQATLKSLLLSHPDVGGVDCFEYFDAAPGGTANPAAWGTQFGQFFSGN